MNEEIEVKISNDFVDYFEAVDFMEKRVQKIINADEKELIWFLNHNNVYTCGSSSKNSEIINSANIPIIKTNRGGKTTYHGPGQRIVYILMNLNNRKKDIRKFINLIETSTIDLLKGLNINATTYQDRVGIWVKSKNIKEKKIAAIGIRIKKWVTYHGLSFNINPNLNYYKNIHACGLNNYSNTSLEELNYKLSEKEFDRSYLYHFKERLKNFSY